VNCRKYKAHLIAFPNPKTILRSSQQCQPLGDPGVDGRIILKWMLRKWYGGMDWIELAQDRDKWRALVNAVMKLRVP
jgi:hypothetical protein